MPPMCSMTSYAKESRVTSPWIRQTYTMMGEPKIPAKRDPIMPEGYDGVTRRKSREAPPFRTWEEFTHHYCECGCGRNIPVKANETWKRTWVGCLDQMSMFIM